MKNSEVKQYEMTSLDGAGVYCGTYKKYNDGSLCGMWIDLEAFSDAEDFFEVCRALHDDEDDPEFMFQDYQGFPEEFYHESMSADDVQKIIDYLQLNDDDRDLLDAYCECFGGHVTDFNELLDKAHDRYCGQCDSFKDFAYQLADEMIACNTPHDADVSFFVEFFDYDAYADSIESGYEVSDGGYIFRNY